MTAPDPKFGPHPGAATPVQEAKSGQVRVFDGEKWVWQDAPPTPEARIEALEQRMAALEEQAVTAIDSKRDDIMPIRALSKAH